MSKIKDKLVYFVLGLLIGVLTYFFVSQFFPPVYVHAFFSPESGNEVITFIDAARQSLDIEMYVFTSDEVLSALKRASDRGVKIRLILEKRVATGENAKNYNELRAYGADVRWASRSYALTHAKFIIADDSRVLVGSHNFSGNAMYENREASVIVQATNIVNDFARVFEEDWIKAE